MKNFQIKNHSPQPSNKKGAVGSVAISPEATPSVETDGNILACQKAEDT